MAHFEIKELIICDGVLVLHILGDFGNEKTEDIFAFTREETNKIRSLLLKK